MDTLKSIWEDFSGRLRSPFIISFLISWAIWNWWIIYSVFNFEPSYTLDYKLVYIESYLFEHFLRVSLIPLITSFIAAGFFYLAKLAFLWLDTNYENKWRIKVIENTGLTEMVPQSDLIDLHKEISMLNLELDSKMRDFARSSGIIQQLQNEVKEFSKLKDEISTKNSQINQFEEEIKSLNIFKNDISNHKSLRDFFTGTWYCEFNLVINHEKGAINYGIEPFSIKNDEYLMDGKVKFIISEIKLYNKENCLTFFKEKVDADRVKNHVSLFKVTDSLWIGFEKTLNGLYSYMRFYPATDTPSHKPIYMSNESWQDSILREEMINRQL
jgi:hypothetical protein